MKVYQTNNSISHQLWLTLNRSIKLIEVGEISFMILQSQAKRMHERGISLWTWLYFSQMCARNLNNLITGSLFAYLSALYADYEMRTNCPVSSKRHVRWYLYILERRLQPQCSNQGNPLSYAILCRYTQSAVVEHGEREKDMNMYPFSRIPLYYNNSTTCNVIYRPTLFINDIIFAM